MQKSSVIFKKLLDKRSRAAAPAREIASAEEQVRAARRSSAEWSAAQVLRRKEQSKREQRDRELEQLETERREAERMAVVRVAAAAALCAEEAPTPPTEVSLARPSVVRRLDDTLSSWFADLKDSERAQLQLVRAAHEECHALFGGRVWGKRVVAAAEGHLAALPAEQEAAAYHQLKPTLWSAPAAHYQMGAEGGFKRLVRPNQFAFEGARVPRAMAKARDRYGQLVVLTTKHRRRGHLAAFADVAQELKLALQMARIGVGPPVVAATLWRLSSAELAALYRSHGDAVPAALAVSSPDSGGSGGSTVGSFDERTAAQVGFMTLVMPLCYSLHALLRNADSDADALFASYEEVAKKVSCAHVLMSDAKPANFLCQVEVGSPPKVYASDFDTQHVRLNCVVAAPALLLAHHLIMYLHVAAEDATAVAMGQSAPQRTRFKSLLVARIAQLWLKVQRMSESDATVERLLLCHFRGAVCEPGRPVANDAALVAAQLEHVIFSYFCEFERYARTSLGAQIERAVEMREPVIASLVAISVPELQVSWSRAARARDSVHARFSK